MSNGRYTCHWCREPFMAEVERKCCGKSPCWEQEYWTDDEWSCRRGIAMKRNESDRVIIYVGTNDKGDPIYTTGPAGPNELDQLALAREP